MYWPLMLTLMEFMLFLLLLMIFIFLQNTQSSKALTFKTSFECGFNNKMKSQNIFSINYFYMTIIFLIFDLEILFILPLVIFKNNSFIMLMMIFFLIFFSLILKMEWNNSMLEWNN